MMKNGHPALIFGPLVNLSKVLMDWLPHMYMHRYVADQLWCRCQYREGSIKGARGQLPRVPLRGALPP